MSPPSGPSDGLDQSSAAWGLQSALMKGVEDDVTVSCRSSINLLGEKGTMTKRGKSPLVLFGSWWALG